MRDKYLPIVAAQPVLKRRPPPWLAWPQAVATWFRLLWQGFAADVDVLRRAPSRKNG
jgi:hypothetical protein